MWTPVRYHDPYTGEDGWTLWNQEAYYSDGFYTSRERAQFVCNEWNSE